MSETKLQTMGTAMRKSVIAAGAMLVAGAALLARQAVAAVAPVQLTPEGRRALAAKIAAELGVEPAVIRAILHVESGGKGFSTGPDGKPRMIIRFEPHIFRRRTEDATGNEIPAPAVVHGSQASEWGALAAAAKLHRASAYESCSYGSGQVMGFNHKRGGYKTAEEMFVALSRSETAHLQMVAGFFRTDPKILAAARAKDWLTIANRYNGYGQVGYDKKIAARYTVEISKGVA